MIKTEKEYLEAKKRLVQEFQAIANHQTKLKENGLNEDQIKLAIDPLASFAHQLKEEVEEYEQLRRGNFKVLENFYGIGRTLVALRIFKGLKQKDLAEKLGIKDSQLSRDERNEYYGASIEKIQKVLDALNVTLKTKIEYSYKDSSGF